MSAAGTALDPNDAAEYELRRPPSFALLITAMCFAIGIAAGRGGGFLWASLVLAGGGVLAAAWLRDRRFKAAKVAVYVAAAAFGAAWVSYRVDHLPPHDLAAALGEEAVIVQLEGIATSTPEFRKPGGGSLARFDYRQPGTYFTMRVDAVMDSRGGPTGHRGRVFVKVGDAMPPFRPGDHLSLTGHLVPTRPPLNPGEFDRVSYARSLGQAGMVVVPDRRLVHVEPSNSGSLVETWHKRRSQLRQQASGQLLWNLPETDSPNRAGLLKALLLGQREPDLDELNDSFQRVGLAHIMAISGLHLGILAGLVLLVVRFAGYPRPWHGWLMITVVLAYLALIEVRLPVLRAGVMTMAACAGMAMGRQWQVGGLVALSAIGLLMWRPDQLFTAGFQLSFGVVLGLVYLQPPVRERWFGKPDREAASTPAMALQWLYTTFATALVAWLVATPIVIYHFGIISPFGVVLSVVGVPIVAIILALGYLKLLLGIVLPSFAMLLAYPLAVVTDALISIVMHIDALPLASWSVPFASVGWTLAALAMVALWARGLRPRFTILGVAVLAFWLSWPMLPIGSAPALRMDMLAVGDGTCIIIRSGGRAIAFDAGSSSSMNAGRQWIVPALRRLNVRTIDAIAISHPDIDHYSATLELVDAFKVPRVIVTPQFMQEVEHARHGPAAHVHRELSRRNVQVQTVVAGHEERLGEATLAWHYPRTDSRPARRNNEQSMLIHITAAGRTALLTGDLEGAGMAELLPLARSWQCDIVELPHHGSYNDLAAEFIAALDPAVVLQSTGHARWQADRWAAALVGTKRLVTARDGACWVQIASDGSMTIGSHLPQNRSESDIPPSLAPVR